MLTASPVTYLGRSSEASGRARGVTLALALDRAAFMRALGGDRDCVCERWRLSGLTGALCGTTQPMGWLCACWSEWVPGPDMEPCGRANVGIMDQGRPSLGSFAQSRHGWRL